MAIAVGGGINSANSCRWFVRPRGARASDSRTRRTIAALICSATFNAAIARAALVRDQACRSRGLG
jgi:hypothetical protein